MFLIVLGLLLYPGMLTAVEAAQSGCMKYRRRAGAAGPAGQRHHRGYPLREFRLGTAARPLAWSTVVEDFDADGTPDLAIADRTSWSGSYCLELILSSRHRLRLPFNTTGEVVSIDAEDIDQDHDLDVVARTLLGHRPVAVWLNDGHGGFTPGDVGKVDVPRSASRHLTIRPLGPVFAAAVLFNPGPSGTTLSVRGPPVGGGIRLQFVSTPFLGSTVLLPSVSPRPPPARSPSS